MITITPVTLYRSWINGTTDELEGLVNFMKGTDYFDYDGDCNITEVRDHVLGVFIILSNEIDHRMVHTIYR